MAVVLISMCLQYSDSASGYVPEADFLEGEEGAGCCSVSRNGARAGYCRDKVTGRRMSLAAPQEYYLDTLHSACYSSERVLSLL